MYTAVSFCSGSGAFDVAVERAGFKIKAQVEIDEFCCRNLEREWPGLLRLRDMHECGSHNLPTADMFFGGIPCQPFSQAGKRAGDEDERNLWPTFKRIIGELRPRVVLLENTPGILDPYRGADGNLKPAYALRIIADLSEMGYGSEWGTLFASDAGASHPRERFVLVAYAHSDRQSQPQDDRDAALYQERHNSPCQQGREAEFREIEPSGEILGNAASEGLSSRIETGQPAYDAQGRTGMECQSKRSSEAVGDTHCLSMAGQRTLRQQVMETRHKTRQFESASYGTGQLWAIEPLLGRVYDGMAARVDRSRWPAPQGPFQYSWEPSRVISTKLPYRKDRIKAIGNGVVPQVFYWVALAIYEWLRAQDALSSSE